MLWPGLAWNWRRHHVQTASMAAVSGLLGQAGCSLQSVSCCDLYSVEETYVGTSQSAEVGRYLRKSVPPASPGEDSCRQKRNEKKDAATVMVGIQGL